MNEFLALIIGAIAMVITIRIEVILLDKVDWDKVDVFYAWITFILVFVMPSVIFVAVFIAIYTWEV